MAKRRASGEGTIRHRADGRWEWRGTLPSGERTSAYGRTQGEALAKRDELLRRVSSGLSVESGRLKLSDYLPRWIEETVAPTVRARTLESYAYLARHWLIPVLGHVRVSQIGPEHVQLLQTRMLAAGLAPATVHRARTTLGRALTMAVRWGYLARNPVPLVDAPKIMRPTYTWLTADQARRLIDETRHERIGPLIAVALCTGLRQGEQLALTDGAVDLAAGTVRVYQGLQRDGSLAPTKSGVERTVPLTTTARRALVEWDERWHVPNTRQLVFTTPHGTPMRSDVLTHDLQARLAALELPRIRWHDLRHTCASLLLAQGVPMKIISDVLGHSDIGVTANIYAHVSDDLRAAAVGTLDSLLDSGRGQGGVSEDERASA